MDRSTDPLLSLAAVAVRFGIGTDFFINVILTIMGCTSFSSLAVHHHPHAAPSPSAERVPEPLELIRRPALKLNFFTRCRFPWPRTQLVRRAR